jgi:hypothetical protein
MKQSMRCNKYEVVVPSTEYVMRDSYLETLR